MGVVIGFIGIGITLPKITRKMDKATEELTRRMDEVKKKLTRRKFPACENCAYDAVCSSPYLDDTGVFDKIREIENSAVSEGIVELYNEIKKYQFDSRQFKYVGTKEHQGCLLHKLTLAINLIGSANMDFNMVKADNNHSAKSKEHGE